MWEILPKDSSILDKSLYVASYVYQYTINLTDWSSWEPNANICAMALKGLQGNIDLPYNKQTFTLHTAMSSESYSK